MAEHVAQLVGRAAELEELERLLALVGRRGSCALEVAGEPGIGKTRLLAELEARANARGHLVLGGSASELGGAEIPFWVFIDALDEYLQAIEPRRLAPLRDDVRAELALVFPSLAAFDAQAAAQDGRHRTHGAVRQLLEVLAASAPLVLVLDDLHWADSGSTELLESLLRRPPAAGVLMALAARPRQVPERLASALERAHRAGGLTRLELRALSAHEARELLGDGLDDAAAARLYDESAGNPFYLEQLARGPRGTVDVVPGAAGVSLAGVDVPRGVAAVLAGELALLPADARLVLEGAAVAGDPFEPELAAAAAGLPETAVLGALDVLLRRDLIRHTDVPRRFRFRHPLVRGSVYECSPGGWRLGAHERSAQALAARHAPATARAHHVERSARHGDMAAVAILREAGRTAAPRAPATAARLFGAALRLLAPVASERLDLLMELASAHAAAGQFKDAYAAVLEGLALAPDDATATVALTAGCARLENLLGHHQQAHDRLTTGLRRFSDRDSPEAVSLMLELAADGMYRMDYASMRDWAQRGSTVARPLGDPALTASAAGVLALGCVYSGAIAQARSVREEGASLIDAMSDEQLAGCLDFAVDTLAATEIHLDRYREAGAHVERSLAIARATGQGHVLPVLFWTGAIRTMRGRLPEAAEVLETAIEVARVSGHAEGMAWNLFARSLTATAAGDVDTAVAAAEESVGALRGLDRSFPSAGAGLALAAALLDAQDPARALEALLEFAGGDDLAVIPAVWRPGALELLTRCRLALGDREQAAQTASRTRACADALGLPMAAALADRAAAAVALQRGDALSAAERALASAAAADTVGAVVEAALARALAGRALAQAGQPDRAAAELRRAAAAFEACGAPRRRAAAERELGKLGRRPYRRTRRAKADGDGIESLTERELEVARLVVDRRTNAQIAAALFLSPKTVESHIRNVFHKLGVSSRAGMARAVERADRAARSATPR